jgi:hypothetical protein
VGFVIGYNRGRIRNVEDVLLSFSSRIKVVEEVLDEEPESAVVTTTPRTIERKRRSGELDTEDSAIITVKSPRQVRKESDLKLQRELDELGR